MNSDPRIDEVVAVWREKLLPIMPSGRGYWEVFIPLATLFIDMADRDYDESQATWAGLFSDALLTHEAANVVLAANVLGESTDAIFERIRVKVEERRTPERALAEVRSLFETHPTDDR